MRIYFIIILSLVIQGHYCFSQNRTNEGYVILKNYNSEQILTEKSNTITYFKGDKIRSESFDEMNGHTIQIIDSKTKEQLILMDNPQFGKTYKFRKMTFSDAEKAKYKVIEGEKKKAILGYVCQQYIIILNDFTSIEIYTTEDVDIPTNSDKSLFGNQIKGSVLYTKFIVETNGKKIENIAEVIEIKYESVPDDKFSLIPPDGYVKLD